MPMYEVSCINGHTRGVYIPDCENRHVPYHICHVCQHTQSPVIARPGSYTYFSEKTPRVLHNLGHEPVTITSHWQHQQELKKRGLGWATPKRGMPGSWG